MQRFVFALLVIGGLSNQVFAQDAEKSATPVNFVEHVLPIFRQHCLQCHNANDAEAGLAIDSYGAVMEGGGSGDVVSAGDSAGSRLYLVMTHDEEPAMPPNQDPIPPEQLEIIKRWIDGGLLENSGSKAKKRKGPSLSFSTSDTGKPDEVILPESVWRVPVVTSDRAAAATAIAASPWAPLVAVAGQRQVAMYHTESHDLLGVLPYPEGIPQVLRFNRDGGYLLVAGGTHSSMGIASLYDIRNGQRLLSVGDELDVVFGADINDSMTRIALGGPQKMVRIFDTASGEAVFELKKHTDWVYCVDYSPDGVLVASGDRSGGLHIWEADTGRLYLDLIGHKAAVRSVVWRADSNVLISASEDGTVKMWEMNAGNQLKSFNAHSGGVTGIAMSQDGKIVTSGKDRTVKVWNADGSAVATMPAFSEPALEVAITHDGTRVVGGDWNGRTLMWEIADPKKVEELQANPPALKQQLVSQQKHVEELAQKRDSVVAKQKAGEQVIAGYLASEKSLAEQVKQSEAAMKKATDDRVAAEKKMSSVQTLAAASEAKINEMKEKIGQQKKAMGSIVASRDAITKQIATVTGNQAEATSNSEKAKSAIAESISKQDSLTSDLAQKTATNAKQEMALLANLQMMNDEVQIDLDKFNRMTATEKSLAAQMTDAKKSSEGYIQQLQALTTKKMGAEKVLQEQQQAISQLNQSITETNATLVELKAKQASSSDEAEKASLAEQVKNMEEMAQGMNAKIQELKKSSELSSADIAKITAEMMTAQKNQDELAGKLSQLGGELSKVQPLIKTASAELDAAKLEQSKAAKQMEDFSAIMGQLGAEKAEVVKQVAGLIKQETQQKEAMNRYQAVIAGHVADLQKLDAEAKRLDSEKDALESDMVTVSQGLAAEEMNLATMANELKTLPAVIDSLTKQAAEYQKSIPELQSKIKETAEQREKSQQALASVNEELATVNQEVSNATGKLETLQTELVAFESTSERLRAEAEKASQLASAGRAELEPLQAGVESLKATIAAQEQKLKTAQAEMARVEKELKMLQQSQAESKAAEADATKKLQESNSAYEALEAAEQEAKEKLEFFQSAYGT